MFNLSIYGDIHRRLPECQSFEQFCESLYFASTTGPRNADVSLRHLYINPPFDTHFSNLVQLADSVYRAIFYARLSRLAFVSIQLSRVMPNGTGAAFVARFLGPDTQLAAEIEVSGCSRDEVNIVVQPLLDSSTIAIVLARSRWTSWRELARSSKDSTEAEAVTSMLNRIMTLTAWRLDKLMLVDWTLLPNLSVIRLDLA